MPHGQAGVACHSPLSWQHVDYPARFPLSMTVLEQPMRRARAAARRERARVLGAGGSCRLRPSAWWMAVLSRWSAAYRVRVLLSAVQVTRRPEGLIGLQRSKQQQRAQRRTGIAAYLVITLSMSRYHQHTRALLLRTPPQLEALWDSRPSSRNLRVQHTDHCACIIVTHPPSTSSRRTLNV